jgi:hypothetical protein
MDRGAKTGEEGEGGEGRGKEGTGESREIESISLLPLADSRADN